MTRVAEVGLRRGRQSGAMSAGDLIVVTAAAVSSLTGVVQAYVAWRASRQAAPALVVTLESGAVVTIVDGTAAEIATLLLAAQVTAAVSEDDETAPSQEPS